MTMPTTDWPSFSSSLTGFFQAGFDCEVLRFIVNVYVSFIDWLRCIFHQPNLGDLARRGRCRPGRARQTSSA